MHVSTGPKTPRDTPAGHGTCLTAELCAEHRELAQQLTFLDLVADEVGAVPLATLRKDVDRAYGLLNQRVLPHTRAEHDLRTRLATHDHRRVRADEEDSEVERLARRLSGLRSQLAKGDAARVPGEIRHVLYELHALTRLHFADQLSEHETGAEDR